MSPDTSYACYLVFEVPEYVRGLKCPVRARDLVNKNKDTRIIYFKSPGPVNLHRDKRLPDQREDGWMEVKVWKFNSKHYLKNDHITVNLKFTSYEGTMSGLILYGLEFRPMSQ